LNTEIVVPVIERLVKQACYELDDNLMCSFRDALKREESPIGKENIRILIENAEYAKKEQLACCHDTGTCVVIIEIGQGVSWEGKPLKDQVNQGVRQGYKNGYLRNSMVADPLERINTNDNTPAVLHTEMVDGDQVTITVMPKGGGSENMGTFKTLLPGAGVDGIKNFVLETVGLRRKSLPALHHLNRRRWHDGPLFMDGQEGASAPDRGAQRQTALRETRRRSPGSGQQHRYRPAGYGWASDRAGCSCRLLSVPYHRVARGDQLPM
jgi:hypothetical protein